MQRIFLWILVLVLTGCAASRMIQHPKLIGRDPTWFPLELGNKVASLTAFSNALIDEINHLERSALQLADVPWIQLFQRLEEGELGGILSALSPNVITQDKYSFSEPMLLLGPVLIVNRDSQATSLKDLDGKTVGVYQYDESVLIAQKNPTVVIKTYENMPTILEELREGKISAVLMPVLEARSLIHSLYPLELKLISEPLNNKAIRLITLKDQNKPLIRQFNRGLLKSEKSGSYFNLRKKFNLD